MQKLQTTKELTAEGKTKPISYGGDGKRAIARLMDEYIEQFTRSENGDWLFGGFSSAQLEGIVAELKKRNSKTWNKLKKQTKKIYSRALDKASDEEDGQQTGPLGERAPELVSGDDTSEVAGDQPKLGSCACSNCGCPDTGSCSVPDGA